jgi:hypothetical protein
MLFGKMIAVVRNNNRKHTNKLCGKDAGILVFKKLDGKHSLPLFFFFTMAQEPPSGPRPPHYERYKITLRHTTLVRTLLYERSA